MREWTLEIETNKKIKKIRNPRKARDIDLGFFSIIKVMDENGKWHFVGWSMFLESAQYATKEINEAIRVKEKSILINYIS